MGFSQQYFWRIVLVLATVTTLAVGAWILNWSPVELTPGHTGTLDRLAPYVVAAVVLAGTLWMLRLPGLLSQLPWLPCSPSSPPSSIAAGVPAAVADLTEPTRRADPSAQTVQRLREIYGARWVFADRRASWVSPDIGRYADLVFENRDVLIYRIP